MKIPHFAFYPADWLSDPKVKQLSLAEEGAYIHLLCLMWCLGKDCTLPDDSDFVAKLLHVPPSRWQRLRSTLVAGTEPVIQINKEGKLTNARLQVEYYKALGLIEKKKEAAQKRWGGHAGAMQVHSTSKADAMHKQCNKESDTDKIKNKALKNIYIHWNSKSNLIKHREKSFHKYKPHIQAAINIATEEEIKTAIDNYDTVLANPQVYFFTYRWTLNNFLTKGLERFLAENKPLERLKKTGETKESTPRTGGRGDVNYAAELRRKSKQEQK